MAFHGILVLRDEADIIAQTLAHLLSWCDTLAVYDTGSADETWDIVQDAARRDDRLLPIASQPVLFHSGLRAYLFDLVRHRYRRADWIARVDADEFYHIPPPTFIRDRLRRGEGRICARLYDFVLTRSELRDWQLGRETIADRARPIQDRRRHFRFDDYPELRLFRYRRSMRWPPTQHNPINGGLLARHRIPILHYRARDPLQIQRRCVLRAATAASTSWPGEHWRTTDWRHQIFHDNDPQLVSWHPGHPLPERPAPDLTRSRCARAAQRFLYTAGLVHLLDQRRPRFPTSFHPDPIPPETAAIIAVGLAAAKPIPKLADTPPPLRYAPHPAQASA